MQSGEVMLQAGVFPFYPRHVGLADNLVTLWNEAGID